MFNKLNTALKYKSIRAINDPKVLQFTDNLFRKKLINNILNDKQITSKFLNTYEKWLQSSKLNKLKNLKKFKFKCLSTGSSQVFDFFYMKHKNRRFRAFKGEYAYHYVSWRNNFKKWKFISDELDIKKNDAVIISLPFSDTGSKHDLMEKLIKKCDALNVPVLVDCCYYSMCKGINFDFNHKSIQEISFSLSKAFPISRARIGMRLSKVDDDDPLFFINKIDLCNRISAFIGLAIIKKFDFDYIFKKYYKKQLSYCRKMKLIPSSVVCLATGDEKWSMYNRGNKRNRLCLSSLYEK